MLNFKNKTIMKNLVEAINGQKVTAEMFGEMKQIAATSMQKLLTGEALTAEEVQISGYVTKIMQQTVVKANKQAEQAAKAAQMEAETARLKQEWEIAMQTALLENVSKVFTPKAIALVKTIADVKALFATVLESLPKEPKVSGPKKVGTTNSTDYSNPKAVEKITEGSTNWHIQNILKAAKAGLTKEATLEKLVANCPDKSKVTLNLTLNRAINGRLPIVVKENKLVWSEPATK